MCELYDRPAEIYGFAANSGAQLLRTFHEARAGSRPPLRLSYYGGGHYDSIVPLDPSVVAPAGEDSAHERAAARARWADFCDAVLRSPPGEAESRRIASQRAAGADGASAARRSRGGGRGDGRELQAALRASRALYDQAHAAHDGDLDAALRNSMVQREFGFAEQLTAATLASLGAADDEARELAVALRLSSSASTAGSSAAASVEDAQVQRALEASRAVGGGFEEYGGIDPAMDPEMAAILQMSLLEERERQVREAARAIASSSADAAGGEGGEAAAEEDDDAMMQAALALSLQGAAAGAGSLV